MSPTLQEMSSSENWQPNVLRSWSASYRRKRPDTGALRCFTGLRLPTCMGRLRWDGQCCVWEAQCGRHIKINWTKTTHRIPLLSIGPAWLWTISSRAFLIAAAVSGINCPVLSHHVCTVSASFLQSSEDAFSIVPCVTLSSSCKATRVNTGHFNCFCYLLTEVLW